MQDFQKLAVWQKAHALAVKIYRLTSSIPTQGNSGFVSQMRRAAEAIPANIAEGCGRASDLDFAKFAQTGLASASELESHLKYAADTALIADAVFQSIQPDVIEVRKMLIGLLKRLDPSRLRRSFQLDGFKLCGSQLGRKKL